MAWSISIAADAWQEIRDELATWSKKRLIDAITDDKFEMVLEKAGHHHAEQAVSAERRRLKRLPHHVLVDRAFGLVEQTDTCDNGGWAYWLRGLRAVTWDGVMEEIAEARCNSDI